jgi:hypothetical protein
MGHVLLVVCGVNVEPHRAKLQDPENVSGRAVTRLRKENWTA